MKVFNRHKMISKSYGFTLVETLVVMLVLLTIGSIILSIFIIGLTGAAKTRNQQIVRENGNYALSQMARFLQFAKAFNYVDVVHDNNLEDQYSSCDPDDDTPYKAISVSTFEGDDAVFACTEIMSGGQPTDTIASFSANLSDPNAATSLLNVDKVQLHGCHFTCRQESPGQPPTIGIHFELSSKNGKENPVIFETSIIPRNF